jgi:hypothetical protein
MKPTSERNLSRNAGQRPARTERAGASESISVASNPESFRSWTLDILNIVRRIAEGKRQRAGALQDASRNSQVAGIRASVLDCGGPPPLSPERFGEPEFTNEDVYAFARELEKLHPDNPDSHREQVGTSKILSARIGENQSCNRSANISLVFLTKPMRGNILVTVNLCSSSDRADMASSAKI